MTVSTVRSEEKAASARHPAAPLTVAEAALEPVRAAGREPGGAWPSSGGPLHLPQESMINGG